MNLDDSEDAALPTWGGLVDTLRELPDAADIQDDLLGFVALERVTTVAETKDAITLWFYKVETRERFMSPMLDQLYLLLCGLASIFKNVYQTAIIYHCWDAYRFLFRLSDAPTLPAQLDPLVDCAAYHEAWCFYADLLRRGGLATALRVVAPLSARIHTDPNIDGQYADVLIWIESRNDKPVQLCTVLGFPLATFTTRFVFPTPLPLRFGLFKAPPGPIRYCTAALVPSQCNYFCGPVPMCVQGHRFTPSFNWHQPYQRIVLRSSIYAFLERELFDLLNRWTKWRPLRQFDIEPEPENLGEFFSACTQGFCQDGSVVRLLCPATSGFGLLCLPSLETSATQ